LTRIELVQSRAAAVGSCFAQMETDAVLGQQLDLLANARDIERVYELKTGSYTVRGPLRLGALMAGGSPRLLTALDRFALPLGVAYQLRDDLLSAFGDPSVTGKPFGSDLKSGKKTVLLLTALKRARGREHRVLKRVIGNPKASDQEVRGAVTVLESSGARDLVEARIDELVARAFGALRAGRVSPEGVALLEGAARTLTMRRN
jgi:geranylgeranyl diphosphate synthase type I